MTEANKDTPAADAAAPREADRQDTDRQDPTLGEPAAREGSGAESPGEATDSAPEVAGLRAQLAEMKDRLLRAVAETDNVRKRAERERDDVGKYAISNFARSLLPVAESLRRAIEAVGPEAREGDPALDAVLVGVEATARELTNAFERNGIRPIQPLGARFDPNFHQALFEVPDANSPPGTVVQVVETGYMIADRLLRPAMVGVSKTPDAAAEAARVDTKV